MDTEGGRAYAPWPAAPGNAATIVLFTTHDRSAGGSGTLSRPSIKDIDSRRVDAITITWLRNDQPSNANGVRVYGYDNTGTWREVDLKDDQNLPTVGAGAAVQVPVLAAGQEWRETLIVSHLLGVCVEYTAGATGPTNWNGSIGVDLGCQVIAR